MGIWTVRARLADTLLIPEGPTIFRTPFVVRCAAVVNSRVAQKIFLRWPTLRRGTKSSNWGLPAPTEPGARISKKAHLPRLKKKALTYSYAPLSTPYAQRRKESGKVRSDLGAVSLLAYRPAFFSVALGSRPLSKPVAPKSYSVRPFLYFVGVPRGNAKFDIYLSGDEMLCITSL